MFKIPFSLTSSALAAGLLASCSGSGGASGAGPGGSVQGLNVTGISLIDQAVVPLNREIRISFSAPLDFSSVNNSSIQISTAAGVRAIGQFGPLQLDTDADGKFDSLDPSVVVWHPNCPLLPDLSDAGLRPGTTYLLRIRGSDSGANQVLRSVDGLALVQTQSRNFSTPTSNAVEVLFEDPLPGAPLPLLRGLGSLEVENVCALEIGADSDPLQRLYFERDDPSSQSEVVAGEGVSSGTLVPLNLYSEEASRIAFLIAFNQPLNPLALNVNSNRIQLEYLVAGPGADWVPLETHVALLQNCSRTGTLLRLEPGGLLPPDSQVRAVLRTGLEGLGGVLDALPGDLSRFAVVQTQRLDHSPLANPKVGADELLESFDIGGAGPNSLEDDGSDAVLPLANWGQGRLSSSTNFDGTGGLGGEFDWIVSDDPEAFDTSSQVIVGGPNGTRSLQQFVVGGVVEVHDFIILPTAKLRVTGPNPFVVNATGEIRIEGILDISGFAAKDVATLNTGSQPEKGGSGNCGGGDGGGASEVRGNSTPQGGPGLGPFGAGAIGGAGGESAFIIPGTVGSNRAGGGGGGRFNADQSDLDAAGTAGSEPTDGMRALSGGPGGNNSEGAVSGLSPAPGGAVSTGPFADGNPANDFFGLSANTQVAILADGTAPVLLSQGEIMTGELNDLHAGYGAGGGGDSLRGPGFPTPDWTVSKDLKGGGGGAGGGAIRLRALGPIRFIGQRSLLFCKGGIGGYGETQLGGYGGSGSGGHVMLESATRVSFELPPLLDRPPGQRRHVFIDARGVMGKTGPAGLVSQGGEGGPGVIQLHVPDAVSPPHESITLSDVILPVGTIEELNAGDANALVEVMRPAGVQLLSRFGSQSASSSRWIDLRSAGIQSDGTRNLLRFLFEGLDPNTGAVLKSGGQVPQQPTLLSGEVDGVDVVIQGSDALLLRAPALQPLIQSSGRVPLDLYLRTPALLRQFVLSMTPSLGTTLDFVVQDAGYDNAKGELTLVVDQRNGVTLGDLSGAVLPPSYRLIPRFFEVSSGGVPNQLSPVADVFITLEGATVNANGLPETGSLLVPATADFTQFDSLLPGQLDFVRFKVEFNLDSQGVGLDLTAPPVALEFLRFPFLY